MSTECIDDGFDVPPIPEPYKISKEDRVATRRRQALFLRQALLIVNRFAHNPVTSEMLASALPWLEREQYDDIAVERNAYGNCGYALCPKPKGEAIKQQYRICVRTRRVYDTTHRRAFCSDWCYRASLYVRKQIPKDPGWCRSGDQLRQCELKLLPSTAVGFPGKLVLDALNRLCFEDSDETDIDATDVRSTITNPNDFPEVTSDHIKRDHFIEETSIDCNNVDDSSSDTEIAEQSEALGSDLNQTNDTVYNLAQYISKRLRDWMSAEALLALTSPDLSSSPITIGKSRVEQLMLTQYYFKRKRSDIKKFSPKPDDVPNVILPNSCVMPLVDSISPDVLRRQILLDDIKRNMQTILANLKVDFQPIYRRLENALLHFRLTSVNVHMNPRESKLMALVILRLMAVAEPTLARLLNENDLACQLRSVCTLPLVTFNNTIIHPALKLYNVDSDDEEYCP